MLGNEDNVDSNGAMGSNNKDDDDGDDGDGERGDTMVMMATALQVWIRIREGAAMIWTNGWGGSRCCPMASDLHRGGREAVGSQGTTLEWCPTLAPADLGWERGRPLHKFVFADSLS